MIYVHTENTFRPDGSTGNYKNYKLDFPSDMSDIFEDTTYRQDIFLFLDMMKCLSKVAGLKAKVESSCFAKFSTAYNYTYKIF
jgi:hypothetical protein